MKNKLKIKIVLLGYAGRLLDIKKITSKKSGFFELDEHCEILSMPTELQGNYLDITYNKETITRVLEDINGDIVIGIMPYRFDDNFYMHRVGKNKLCLSIADTDFLFRETYIPIENFILKNIYMAVLLHTLSNGGNSDEVYSFLHFDTRGCLFDMNGDKSHVVYNTEQPILCEECLAKINRKAMPANWVKNFPKELQRIRKPKSLLLEKWVRQHPFLSAAISFGISALIALIVNIITNRI